MVLTEGLMGVLNTALLVFQILLILLVWLSLRRAIRSPSLPTPQVVMPRKRIITHPGGQFTVDDGKRRDAVINDDETIWRAENNEG